MRKLTARPHWTILALLLVTPLLLAAGRGENRDAWQQPQRVMTDLGLKKGQVVADVGCGSGYLTFRLAKAVGETGKVFATDIDAKALEALDDRVKKDGLKNIETLTSDPTKTKLKADSVDVAVMVNVLHHVPAEQRPPLLKDIAQAIKPGGCFFIADWRPDAGVKHDKERRIPKEKLVELCEDAGLELDAEYHYLINQTFLRLRKPPAKGAAK